VQNYRSQIIDLLIPYFERDGRHHLLVGDSGFGALNGLQGRMPDRVTNCGIMEQGMVGIAAGMALGGMIPVVYTICNFLVYRALEQVRNDVVLQGLNVKFIGTGARDYFQFLGPSHTCGDQDLEIFALIGLDTFDPYAPQAPGLPEIVGRWMTSDQAGYIRV